MRSKKMRPINEGEFTDNNERFFQSSTLYKKELKEKQKNFVLAHQHHALNHATLPSTLSSMTNSLINISPKSLPFTSSSNKSSQQHQNPHNKPTNKMFNLINNFLNRSHANSASLKQAKTNTNQKASIGSQNELRLKRASSTQFNSQKNLSFKNMDSKQSSVCLENFASISHTGDTAHKQRLSYDDELSNQFDMSTTLSCKNSGLIFVPPPPPPPPTVVASSAAAHQSQSSLPVSQSHHVPPSLHSYSSTSSSSSSSTCSSNRLLSNYEKLNTSMLSANEYDVGQAQRAVYQRLPQHQPLTLLRASTASSSNLSISPTSNHNQQQQQHVSLISTEALQDNLHNAFDNNTYSYVENIRLKSKQHLSFINLLSMSHNQQHANMQLTRKSVGSCSFSHNHANMSANSTVEIPIYQSAHQPHSHDLQQSHSNVSLLRERFEVKRQLQQQQQQQQQPSTVKLVSCVSSSSASTSSSLSQSPISSPIKEQSQESLIDTSNPLLEAEFTLTLIEYNDAKLKNVLNKFIKKFYPVRAQECKYFRQLRYFRLMLDLDDSNDDLYKFTIDFAKDIFINSFHVNRHDDYADDSHAIKSDSLNDDLKLMYTNELHRLFERKLNFFNRQLNQIQEEIQLNVKLGNKTLMSLEQMEESNLNLIDKYKLLSSESDMIINLIMKHCSRLASIQNRIYLNTILNVSSSSNDQQEFNHIQRKKDETLYLKQGIDKRALLLRDNLKKCLSEELIRDYDKFLKNKVHYAINLRHLQDNIELIEAQKKLLVELETS